MKKTLLLIGSATLLTACATNASKEQTINLDM